MRSMVLSLLLVLPERELCHSKREKKASFFGSVIRKSENASTKVSQSCKTFLAELSFSHVSPRHGFCCTSMNRKESRMAKTVREIMTAEVTTLKRNDSLLIARDIMTLGRVRHFPVVDEDNKLVGVVSQRDLYRASLGSVMKYGEKAQRAFLEGIAVKEVMSAPAITIAPQASVQEAARLMMEKKIGCLPVLEGTQLVGLITETDMLKLVAEM